MFPISMEMVMTIPNYDGYNFNFNPNGSCTAIKMVLLPMEIVICMMKVVIRDLHYDGDALDEMEEDWKVLEFTAAIIRLKHESNGGNDNHYINLSKN